MSGSRHSTVFDTQSAPRDSLHILLAEVEVFPVLLVKVALSFPLCPLQVPPVRTSQLLESLPGRLEKVSSLMYSGHPNMCAATG